MKNQWNGSGFIASVLELKYVTTKAGEQMAMLKFSVGVKRKGKDAGSDFISCVAMGKNAENIGKFFSKGKGIEITGRIQTGQYTNKEGQKVYTTEIYVEDWDFPPVKKSEEAYMPVEMPPVPEIPQAPQQPQQAQPQPQPQPVSSEGFMKIPENIVASIPFK